LNNLIWDAEVQDNVVAGYVQIDEFAGRLFNEPLTPVRSDSVSAASFVFAPAVALRRKMHKPQQKRHLPCCVHFVTQ